ncbi:MAG: cytochrome C oxidase subunit IV family protein [Pseudomonadota bacterium]|nr:cytochrome C oxidase subunit IV family protein [Pseudomonadota bacterium]
MTLPSVTLGWIALLGLSAATVLVTTGGTGHFSPALFGGLLLLLAFIKARIILSRYLGLWQAPAWLSGFSWVIGFFCLLLLVLYVAPGLSP